MNSFNKDFLNFMYCRQDEAYKAFLDSTKVKELDNYLCLHKTKYESILNKLSSKDRSFLIEYHDKFDDRTACSYDYLYMAGMKDCIRLLKVMGVL